MVYLANGILNAIITSKEMQFAAIFEKMDLHLVQENT